ncbi:unnamed protein product [Nesidiocoris tenuis]|uniref:Uncharacterized protein n=1 Tax=Nesidiocoris tenuis TaxID=355587 RepID=A0A6H5GGN3_9HEMI|nr:unnamed protein product [Nesidiocoris tenuis]
MGNAKILNFRFNSWSRGVPCKIYMLTFSGTPTVTAGTTGPTRPRSSRREQLTAQNDHPDGSATARAHLPHRAKLRPSLNANPPSLPPLEEQRRNKEDEFGDENWYSSDEEAGSGPLSSILNKISNRPKQEPQEAPKVALPNVNVRLSSFEYLFARDPRMRVEASPPPSSSTYLMNLPPLDMDLRLGSTSGPSTSGSSLTSGDVDLRQLPFKPVPVHQAAREIDASLSANPPIPWHLVKVPPMPPIDFSHVHPKNVLDPRLKRYIGEGASSRMSAHVAAPANPPQFIGHPPAPQPPPSQSQQPAPSTTRDPRQRALANDPRRMAQASAGPMVIPQMPPIRPMLGPHPFPNGPTNGPNLGPSFHPHQGPPMPPGMYPMPGDSDMRNPNMNAFPGDVDLRFPPSGPSHHHQHYP